MHARPLARSVSRINLTLLLLASLIPVSYASAPVHAHADDPSNPSETTKLIFIHHSCGSNWLNDGNGGLGIALRDANYFVSDTNYGWGTDSIGSRTDIGHWWTWFQGPSSGTYTAELYAESEKHSSYSRLASDPGGENEIIMFKSCYPNSNVRNATGAIPTGDNPLRGDSCGSSDHTLNNCQGIYADLLDYFATRQDKLFVVITAPPLQSSSYGTNARTLNDWLVDDWLDDYPYNNVAVFDFYNVLTSNGGDAYTNDLGSATGNHHRWRNGAVEHTQTVSNNLSSYAPGDSHPSAAGNQKATGEFVELLNVYYHRWQGSTEPPPEETWSVHLPWIANYGTSTGWSGHDALPRTTGDVDGDGRDDIVGFGDRATYASLSTGSGFGAPQVWIRGFGPHAGGWGDFDTYPRCLGDMDGDGRDDIVGFADQGVLVSLSTGGGFDAATSWLSHYGSHSGGWTSFDAFPRMVGDVDGDSLDDVVGFGESAVYVSLSDGSSLSEPQLWATEFCYDASGWQSYDQYPRMLGDVNGDDMADIVGFGDTAVYVARSTGTAFERPEVWLRGFCPNAGGWHSFDANPRCLADVDGDGLVDIVGFKDSGTYVSYSTGAGFSAPELGAQRYGSTAGGWSSQDLHPRMAADVDADGQADLVGFGDRATLVALAN